MAPKKVNAKSKQSTESDAPPSPSPQLSAIESDSDFPTAVLSPKKAVKPRRPAPGSPDFVKLDAVTMSPRKTNLQSVSRKLSFGELTDEESTKKTTLRSPADVDSNKRTRKPSEKVVYMAADSGDITSDGVEETPKRKKTTKKDKGKSKAATASNDSDSSGVVLVSSTWPSRETKGSPAKPLTESKRKIPSNETPAKKRKQVERSPSVEIPTPAPQGTNKNDTPAKKRLRLVPKSPEVPPRSSKKSPEVPSHSSDIAEEEAVEVPQEADDDVTDVLLQEAYLTLQKYPTCQLIPFRSGSSGQGPTAEVDLLGYSPLLEALPGLQPKNFYHSVNFTASGQFVNPTRDPSTAVIYDNDRLNIPGTKRSAIFLTTGVVSTCNIIEPTTNHQQNRIRRIQVIPLASEKSELYGYVTPDVALSFTSRKEGAGQANSNPSPKKGSKFFATAKVPLPSTANGSKAGAFPSFKNYDDNIPIYDCRETRFRFDENSFSTINDLPLYNTDPDPDSLVSVAYTVNSMAYAQVVNNPRTEIGVFFNILFVLLLGQLPEPSVKSESE